MKKEVEEIIKHQIEEIGIINIDKLFEKKAIISIEAIGMLYVLKGFLFKTKVFENNYSSKYGYFIYTKIPGKLYYYFSEKTYSNLQICQEDLKQKMRLFPLFGFRSKCCIE